MKVCLDFAARLSGWWGNAGLGTHTEKPHSGSIPSGQIFQQDDPWNERAVSKL